MYDFIIVMALVICAVSFAAAFLANMFAE